MATWPGVSRAFALDVSIAGSVASRVEAFPESSAILKLAEACAAILGNCLLHAGKKPESHVLAEPHDVVGAPGIVEEIAVDTRGKIRLDI